MCLRRIERLVNGLLSEETPPTVNQLAEMARHGDEDALDTLSKMALGDKKGDVREIVNKLDLELCHK